MRVESGQDFPGGQRPPNVQSAAAVRKQQQQAQFGGALGGGHVAQEEEEPRLFIPEGGGAAIGADGKPDWQLVDSEAARLRAKCTRMVKNSRLGGGISVYRQLYQAASEGSGPLSLPKTPLCLAHAGWRRT